MAKVPTTYVPNAATARTRNVDALSFPFPGKPQPLTLYVRFVERGAITTVTNFGDVVMIGDGTGTQQSFRFGIERWSDGYYAAVLAWDVPAISSIDSNLAAAPTLGQVVELCATLSVTSAGVCTVSIQQSINGATTTTGNASGSVLLRQQWEAATVTLGTQLAFRDVLVLRGVHTLETMRKRAGQ